jgi:uncharacterized protein (DUF2062 family)
VIAAEPTGAVGPGGRVLGWIKHHIPTRESIETNRWLRPVAHRILVPSLWRFNRRSVPRGVALGVATGILCPVAHMPLAAVLSFPFRANIPVAVGVTIPSTFMLPGIWWLSYRVGKSVLRVDRQVPGAPIATNVRAHAGWFHWLMSQGGPSMIVGLLIVAAVAAPTSYFLTKFIWRLRIARKYRRRHLKTGN